MSTERFEIRISRQSVFQGTGRSRPFAWVYSYTQPFDDVLDRRGGGVYVREAGSRVEYGKGLASLRSMLRHKFTREVKDRTGLDIQIVEEWKS